MIKTATVYTYITFIWVVIVILVVPITSLGQNYYPDSLTSVSEEADTPKTQPLIPVDPLHYSDEAISVGFLHGGGALIGGDFEMLITDAIGVQVGAGLIGFGAGVNYHFKKNNIRSDFVSWQLWNQGIGPLFFQRSMGPLYVYRGKKWFTAAVGVGVVLDRGPAFPNDFERTPVIFKYSLGAYFLK